MAYGLYPITDIPLHHAPDKIPHRAWCWADPGVQRRHLMIKYIFCTSNLSGLQSSQSMSNLSRAELWAWSWSRCTSSQPAGDFWCHPCGRVLLLSARPAYLPSWRTSPSFDRYQVILLGDRGTQVWTTYQRLLSRWPRWDSNPQPKW